MSVRANDPEMRRRFEAAEKICVGDTALRQPALRPDAHSLRAHFASEIGRARRPLDNPHLEDRVSDAQRARALPAAVLIAVVLREPEPTVLVTKRHHGISNPGHWVFPGGRAEEGDATPTATALREAEEEIGLARERVEVLGRLGDYVSHSGFRISPAVALVRPPVALTPQPGEVEEIAEIALSRLLDSANYLLYRLPGREDRAHFALTSERAGLMLNGATVSLCIGLYSELLKTQGRAER